MSTGDQLKKELKAYIERVSAPKCEADWKERRRLRCGIALILRQKGLTRCLSIDQVISDSYVAAWKTIENKGKKKNLDKDTDVKNVEWWFKGVCRKVAIDVIRQEYKDRKARQECKDRKTAEQVAAEPDCQNPPEPLLPKEATFLLVGVLQA